MVATVGWFVSLCTLFVSADVVRRREKGGTALRSALIRVDRGGHNNIKTNPVIRGMVRRKYLAD